MYIIIILTLLITVVPVGIVYYRRKLSGRAVLEKAFQDAANSVNTAEEIYTRMTHCTAMNGSEFNSIEGIEEDLKQRDKSLRKLEKQGFESDLYNNLNEVEKNIYLMINGYDLELFPEYLIVKAINIISKDS